MVMDWTWCDRRTDDPRNAGKSCFIWFLSQHWRRIAKKRNACLVVLTLKGEARQPAQGAAADGMDGVKNTPLQPKG